MLHPLASHSVSRAVLVPIRPPPPPIAPNVCLVLSQTPQPQYNVKHAVLVGLPMLQACHNASSAALVGLVISQACPNAYNAAQAFGVIQWA